MITAGLPAPALPPDRFDPPGAFTLSSGRCGVPRNRPSRL